jgi:hypothetical protein
MVSDIYTRLITSIVNSTITTSRKDDTSEACEPTVSTRRLRDRQKKVIYAYKHNEDNTARTCDEVSGDCSVDTGS